MKLPKLSIASLLLFTAVAAFETAPIATGSVFWLRVQFTATVAALLYAILATIYSEASRRAFWLDFALFGWVALLADVVPWFDQAGFGYQFVWEGFLESMPSQWETSSWGSRRTS